MSSFAGYCDWCGKPVMHKTFFGTLHFCLTPEEKAQKIKQRQLQRGNNLMNTLAKLHPNIGKPYGDR